MRILIVSLAALLGACATGGDSEPNIDDGSSPFPVERGQALPPPAQASQTPPPEGVASGGLDFGQWRGAAPAAYAPAFQAQVRERFAGQNVPALRASLEANGFRCEDERRLDCRIEIMERQCAIDWYVVLERGAREPVAGFERLCLGANG